MTVLRGLKAVARAASAVTEAELKEAWSSSSVRPVVAAIQDSGPARMVREAAGRSGAVLVGLKEYSVLAARGFPQVKPSHSGDKKMTNGQGHRRKKWPFLLIDST